MSTYLSLLLLLLNEKENVSIYQSSLVKHMFTTFITSFVNIDQLINQLVSLFCKQTELFVTFRVAAVFSTESPSAEPLTSVVDGIESSSSTDLERPALPRSTSERLLVANREFFTQEKDLREKYHEVIFATADKVMRASQANQFKSLKVSYRLTLVNARALIIYVRFRCNWIVKRPI